MLRMGYRDEPASAEFLDARVEELARIIASNAPIAMRGMKHVQRDRAQQARRSRRRPPDLARRQSAGRQRRTCREATAVFRQVTLP
jgi:enoyl-CoA hydratase/carnithine racemase